MSDARCDVMMVDDDELVLLLMTRRLRDSGLVLETRTTAEAAHDWLSSGRARLLLVDLHMHPVGGLELLERLHVEGGLAATRVFVCTAAAPDAATLARLDALGAGVLLKEAVLAEGGVERLLECA